MSKLFGEFGVEGSEQTCPGREILHSVSRGDFGKYQTFRAGILGWIFFQGWWFVWQKWVSSTSASLSWMQAEAPPPDASHISGPGLEDDQTPLQCLQSWTHPLPWALSALQFILSSVSCGHNHLLLTIPQVPMHFCTFSLLMFKLRLSPWTTVWKKQDSEEPAAMSRADEPHFPCCSDQDFPSNLSLSRIFCDSQPQVSARLS